MTKAQLNNICTLAMASRKASHEEGAWAAHFGRDKEEEYNAKYFAQKAEDAYAALMSAIHEVTEDQQSNEWIEEPAK